MADAKVTPAYLAEVRARVDAATKGPWVNVAGRVTATESCPGHGCPFEDCEGEPQHEFVVAQCEQDYQAEQDIDGPFIAHARADVPALLDRIEELERELAAAKARVERLTYRLSQHVGMCACPGMSCVSQCAECDKTQGLINEARAAISESGEKGGENG